MRPIAFLSGMENDTAEFITCNYRSSVSLKSRGADFRTSFERIGGLRALTKAPFLSLTASAPPDVECHIISSLQLRDPVLVKLGLNRPNIFYSVRTRSTIQVSIHYTCS